MKKNKMKFLKTLTFLFILSLFSCSEDLYETESNKSNYKVSYVNSVAIQNNKELVKTLRNEKIIKTNSLNKIVIDTVNNFSIDTDFVKFLQGPNFNSYTFKIIEQEDNYLDNLVLVSQAGAPYSAFIMRYNLTEQEKIALNNGQIIDFTNKAKVLKLSNSNIANDALVKLIYYEECNWVSSWQEVTTITPCPIDGCWDAEWTGTSVSHVLVGSWVCTGGGGGGDIGGDVGTSPHGGNSGGTTTKTPCQQLKDNNSKPIANTTPPKTVLDNLNDLTSQMATNPRERMYIMTPYTALETQFVETYVEGPLNGGDVSYNLGNNAVSIIMHCHYDTALLSVFSLSDIQQMYQSTQVGNIFSPDTFTSYLVTTHGTKYAIKFAPQNPNSLTGYNENFFTGWEYDNIKDIREKAYEQNVNNKNTVAQNELGFLKFLKNQNLGVEIYKADATFSQWSKLTIGTNGQVKPVPCP